MTTRTCTPARERHRRSGLRALARLRSALLLCPLIALLPASQPVAADSAGLEAARMLFDAGQLDAADRAFAKLAAVNPDNAEVNATRGEIALLRNEPETAIAFFQRAVAAAPGVSRYHHRLGDAYGRAAQTASIFRALGLARKCLAAFQRAVELDPGNLDARYSLFTFHRGAPGIIGGGLERAAAEAAAIRQIDPDRGRIAFAALHVHQGNLAAARAELAEITPHSLAQVRGKCVFLSDVAWSAAEVGRGEPARNHAWFDEEDPDDIVLLVHGRLYAKGLAAHSPSRYAFDLDGGWSVFSATLGLRDGTPVGGAARFIVRGDGRELFRSRLLRAGDSQRVAIDIAGVRELELVTFPEGEDDRFSRAVWAAPVVRR